MMIVETLCEPIPLDPRIPLDPTSEMKTIIQG